MKLYKTLLFIFSLLLLLGITALTFPEGGVDLWGIHLNYPTLDEALSLSNGTSSGEDQSNANDTVQTPQLTPEENLQKEMEELFIVESAKRGTPQSYARSFIRFSEESSIRIAMPRIHHTVSDTLTSDQHAALQMMGAQRYDSIRPLVDEKPSFALFQDTMWVAFRDSISEDITYLDSFFTALDSAQTQHVRIIHYGDSQIEEDRITSGLREHFQTRFGGGGCGMLPGQQWITHMTCRQSTSPELTNYVCFGTNDRQIRSRRYGPMAVMAKTGSNAKITVSMSDNPKFAHVSQFNRITLIRDVPGSDSIQFITQEYDEMMKAATVNVEGPAEIYGVMFDQKTGISMDNVAMRGSSGNVFTRIEEKTFAPFFQHENVRLIILQYGGNMVPVLGTEEKMRQLCVGLQKQIRYFRRIAPEAKILFIGPSDMATNVGGVMQTYPKLPRFVELLEEYMTECGIAFWNMYEAMGGKGSMVKWVDARPQLAGEDYIHFTHKGAEHMSDLLYETIDTYYKYYKYRRGETISEPEKTDEPQAMAETIDK